MTSMDYETFKRQQKLGLTFADLYYRPPGLSEPVAKHGVHDQKSHGAAVQRVDEAE